MTVIIRASSLPGYGDCSRRWAANHLREELEAAGYMLKGKPPGSIGGKVGTATHTGAAHTMLEVLESGALSNKVEAEQAALDELKEQMQDAVLYDEATKNANEAQRQVVRMVKVFREQLAPTMQPSAVERRLKADVGDGFILSGQSDLQLVSPDGIDDLKTGARMSTHYAQIGSYSILVRAQWPDMDIKRLRVDFIPRVSMKRDQPDAVFEDYDRATAENAAASTINRIKQDVEEFRTRYLKDTAPPAHAFLANPGSMLCSPKFCPAHGTNFCKEHKKS